jgi:hypothetical protein
MYVKNTITIQHSNQGGPGQCVKLEADITNTSPEEMDIIATPGSVVLPPRRYTS